MTTVHCPWCLWKDTWEISDGSAEQCLWQHKSICPSNPIRVAERLRLEQK